MQVPAAQYWELLLQSVSTVQVMRHAVGPQISGRHEVVPLSTQVPLPSHVSAFCCVTPAHDDAAQTVPATYLRHAPAPHVPSLPHVDTASGAHSLSGSVPAATLPHVPFVPPPFFAAEHATQTPLQAVAQHTVSTQNPLAHPVPQGCPFLFLQTPAPSQVVVPVHVFGAVVSSFCGRMLAQVPFVPPVRIALQALQTPVQPRLQQKPSAQKPLEHSPGTEQVWPLSFLQLPLPSHELGPLQAGIVSSRPAVMLAQLPLAAPVSTFVHAWQTLPHMLLQQTPSAHEPLTHCPPVLHGWPLSNLQFPIPSQAFGPLHAGKLSSVPDFTLAQVPLAMFVSARVQPWHVPLQALLQQTPSTQKWLPHSAAVAQGWPGALPQKPMSSQTRFEPQDVPGATGVLTGVEPLQESTVQRLLSSGRSPVSVLTTVPPEPSQTTILQSFGVWDAIGVLAGVGTWPQTWALHVLVMQVGGVGHWSGALHA